MVHLGSSDGTAARIRNETAVRVGQNGMVGMESTWVGYQGQEKSGVAGV